MNRQESVGDSRSAASSRFLFLEPFAHSEPKKSNPVSQGEDDALKMSNPPRWRHRVRFFRRAIRVRARGFEISVRLGEQPTNQENTELKKSISKKDFQVNKNCFWLPAPQSTFDSSGAPKGSNF